MEVWVLWETVSDSDCGSYSEMLEIFSDKATAEMVCAMLNEWSERVWIQSHSQNDVGPYQCSEAAYQRLPYEPQPYIVSGVEVR